MASHADYQAHPLPFSGELDGISKKTVEIHHDKLYVGYVNKLKEVSEKLKELALSGTAVGNATYSDLRSLKDAETFAVNGVYLHEWYFDILGGDGNIAAAPTLSRALAEKWGSVENAMKYLSACGMASRGWSVVCWDLKAGHLKHYNGDAHNQGGVWGCVPVLVLDCYEHAYFLDYGSDKAAYIAAFWKNLDWAKAEALFVKAASLSL